MVDRKCIGCGDESESTHMFKANIHAAELDKWVDEVYCCECIANIMTDLPEIISKLEAI
ncbi:hypothetical protein LCGC14_0531270 [marine sediment metagenome]|uniref:Uncharacterized protein n=1 Tax=marine sediment metagenome TaxID=412755 RepID=A0A0F9UGW6_9ZZZZ